MGLAQSIIVRVGADITQFRSKMGAVLATTKTSAAKMRAQFAALRTGITQAGVAIASTVGVVSGLSIKAASNFERELRLLSTLIDVDEAGLKRLGVPPPRKIVSISRPACRPDVASSLRSCRNART